MNILTRTLKLLGEWFKAEIELVPPLIENAADFGAYAATLDLARMFQVAGCDHLKKIKRVNHVFPDVDDVRRSKDDNVCINVVNRFLKRFWMDGGGRALAFEEAAEATRLVFTFLFC